MNRGGILRLGLVLVALALAACDSGVPLRVYNNPYSEVDWNQDFRLKAQHHDHVGTRAEALLAYDRAGYDVVSLLDYSGNPRLSYAWRERIWPPERFFAQSTLDGLRNIKLLLPNAEEVGGRAHLTSPFLTTYIEGVDPQQNDPLPHSPMQYASTEEALALIRSAGGFPCIAHPWTVWYASFEGSFCVEIYTAFASASRYRGVPWFQDREPDELLTNWDFALQQNQYIWGIAVNDHFGPQRAGGDVPADILDSGKIVVHAKALTLSSYREAFERGAFFAVQDRGAVKDRTPRIYSITVTEELIFIETGGAVVWKANGGIVGHGATLFLSDLSTDLRYVRAEIEGDEGSVVYTQPFALRPIGDANGDFHVDRLDEEACDEVDAGQVHDPRVVAACAASSI